MTTDDFNAWVGLPTEARGDETTAKQPLEQLEVSPDGASVPQLGGNKVLPHKEIDRLPKPRVNMGNLQQNEGFSSRQNSETSTEQRFEPIESNIGSNPRTTQPETREYYNKQPFQAQLATHNACISKVLNIPAKSSYWVDGSELGQKLDPTQTQALRNLEDGLQWLVKLPGRLKAFEQGFRDGFREGLKNTPMRQGQAPSQPQVIPIHSNRSQPIPMAA